jgi:hypothetical protein
VVEAEARHRVHRMVEELEGMRLGRTARPRGDFSHVINATENCRASLDAVTNVITYPHWWQSDLARRYWEANKAAVDRRVRVRRVFIYDQLTDDLRALVEEHCDAGVEVAIVRHETLDPESLRNFAVWDDRSAWEGQMNAHAEMVSNVLVVNAQEVGRFVELFQRCWESAHRYGTGL